jgi:two-component system LytT family response regulator
MLKIFIADDEALARATIKSLLVDAAEIGEIYEVDNGKRVIELYEQYQPDIIFLDIEMPGLSGIEVAKQLPPHCAIIFVTAFNEHAVTAFELNAIDYLLKPFDDERFHYSLEKAIKRVKENQFEDYAKVSNLIQQLLSEKHSQFKDRLVVRDPGRIRLVDVEQISYIIGAGNYAEIHLNDGKQILHRETLSTLETQLDPAIFVRIHRSSIVRRSSIVELRPNEKGDYSVILKSGDILTLSRRNRAKLDDLTH